MKCPHIPEIGYGEFSRRLREKVAKARIPLNGSLEVTNRCNLSCCHCYINLPAADEATRQGELTLAQWRRVIDDIVAEGCLWLLMTGGEPFLRPDFLDIYTYAKSKGLLLTVFTNGTLITPAIADHLARWLPFSVEITVYGRTRETYEAVTGVPGSYEKCLKGLELLLDRRIKVIMKTMAMTLNEHEIPEMQAWAEELGLRFRFDPALNPRLDGSQKPCALRISPEKVVQLDLADHRRVKEWQGFLQKYLGSPEDDYLFQCGAGVYSFHIDPYGSLSICMMARSPGYPLLSGSFREGWREALPPVRWQKRRTDSPCARCELISLCDQCPGWAQLEQGDPEELVEYLCKIAHLRAAAFGREARAVKTD